MSLFLVPLTYLGNEGEDTISKELCTTDHVTRLNEERGTRVVRGEQQSQFRKTVITHHPEK